MNKELVKERLLEATGKKRISLTALATKIKRNRTYFRDFMSGKKQSLSYEALLEAAAILETDAAWLSGTSPTEKMTWPALSGPPQVPLYRLSTGANGRFELLDQVDTKPWPVEFGRATPSYYAFMISGEALEPRYESGDILYVDASRPPRLGNWLIARVEENGKIFCYIGRYLSMGGDKLVLKSAMKSLSGKDELKLDRSAIKDCGIVRLVETA
jgi:phage repressor protein C with HTH and peptisase S24 domain